jgi:hypothetical protein
MHSSHERNTGQNRKKKMANKSFENVVKFIYFGMTIMNQNCIREEIRSRLMLGNACYHLVQDILAFSLLYKNINVKIHRPLILPVSLYGCKTWSLTLREEYRIRVLENSSEEDIVA